MRLFLLIVYTVIAAGFAAGQDSSMIQIANWMKVHNISIRKTFDGSKNEKKPAGLSLIEDHLSENDYLNVDLAVKLSELELMKKKRSSLVLYPKIEWHRSTDSLYLKNKLNAGINFELFPFSIKSYKISPGLPNKGLVMAPWLQGSSSFKRNFIDNVYELKLLGQISLVSNYKYFPGYLFRDSNDNYRGIYYPYFGIEYNCVPDLIEKGYTEKFSAFLVRLFIDLWISPQTIQLNIDVIYRRILNQSTQIRISIGYEYKHGYDPEIKYKLAQISSFKINMKF